MHDRFERAKTHLKKNRRVYIGTASGFAIGAVSAWLLTNDITIAGVQQAIAWKSTVTLTQTTTVEIPRRSTPANRVQQLENHVIYPSQNVAAAELGGNAARLSEHLHGKRDHFMGKHFKVVGTEV